MITELAVAVHERLAGDATLTAMLATYQGEPTVFSQELLPGDAVLPFVLSSDPYFDEPDDTKNREGRDLRVRIRCFTAADGSGVLLRQIVDRVRVLLHRQPLEIDGVNNWSVACSTLDAPADRDIYGRAVEARLRIQSLPTS